MVIPISFTRMLNCWFLAIIIPSLASTAFAQSPMLTEVMNFAPIPVGAKRELRSSVEGLPPGGSYQVLQAPSQPFTLMSDGNDLTVRGNEIEIRVAFEPVSEGDFRDEIILQRTPSTGQQFYDVVRIRLFGTAFRIQRTDNLEFGNVMTGDTAKQVVLYRVNRNDDFTFAFQGSLQPPFIMLTPQGPVRRGIDTLAIVVAFSPTAVGTVLDTIGLIRRDRMGRNLDTAYIKMNGIGNVMPESTVVNLRDLTAGDYANRTVSIDLPAKLYVTNFTYNVEPRSASSYTSASIISPTVPSKTKQVNVGVTANPQKRVDERTIYMLLRKHSDGRAVDSTAIILDVAAASRPNTWTATLGPEIINARIGDTLLLALQARTSDPVDEPTQLQSLTCSISYNPTVFVPLLDQNQKLSVVDNKQVLVTSGIIAQPPTINGDGDTIVTLRAVVALGDADSTVLDMSDVVCTDNAGKEVVMKGTSTTLRITNAWRYAGGRTRLVNTLQDLMRLDIDPNPIETSAVLRVRDLPRETTPLVIIDAIGAVRADLSSLLKSGKRDFTIASSGSADVVLSPGTYYARCAAESILGNMINSIVRLFVVK